MSEERQNLICEVVGQISEDLDSLYVEGIVDNLLKHLSNEQLREYLNDENPA
jgi:hypothetical protein